MQNSLEKWVWVQDPKTYTDEQKNRILAKMVEVMVKTVLSTYFYQWDGKIYHQAGGGPIGLRAYGVIAKVTMECWTQELKAKIELC